MIRRSFEQMVNMSENMSVPFNDYSFSRVFLLMSVPFNECSFLWVFLLMNCISFFNMSVPFDEFHFPFLIWVFHDKKILRADGTNPFPIGQTWSGQNQEWSCEMQSEGFFASSISFWWVFHFMEEEVQTSRQATPKDSSQPFWRARGVVPN